MCLSSYVRVGCYYVFLGIVGAWIGQLGFFGANLKAAECVRLNLVHLPKDGSTSGLSPSHSPRKQQQIMENLRALGIMSLRIYGDEDLTQFPGNAGLRPGYDLQISSVDEGAAQVFRYPLPFERERSPRALQVVILRGTYGVDEWSESLFGSSLVVGSAAGGSKYLKAGGVHASFFRAASKIKRELLRKKLLVKDHRQPVILAGHSRGAAVAALLATELAADGYLIGGIYGLASPKVLDREAWQLLRRYSLAHKVVNVRTRGDYVPHVPLGGEILSFLESDPEGFFAEVRKRGILIRWFLDGLQRDWERYIMPKSEFRVFPIGSYDEALACLDLVNKGLGQYVRRHGLDLPSNDPGEEEDRSLQEVFEELVDGLETDTTAAACVEQHVDHYIQALDLQRYYLCSHR